MKRTRSSLLYGLAVSLVLLVASSSGAADQVPRQWTQMSLSDIDVHPWTWAGWDTCVLRGQQERAFQMCELQLVLPDGRETCCIYGEPYMTDVELHVLVMWREREPVSECEEQLGSLCTVSPPDRRTKAGNGRRAANVVVFEFAGNRPRAPELGGGADSLRRALDDILARIELYAIPCTCGGRPVAGSGERSAGDPPLTDGETDSSLYDQPGATPPDTVATLPGGDLLGQGDEAACWEGMHCDSESRAMRRTGFPPDVEVTSLRLFPSVDHLPPREERAYSGRFSQAIDYLNVELNLAYPERDEAFPFEMEVVVLENGEPYATFSRSMSIEPGWTESHHSAGYGRSDGGFWVPGRYAVEVSVKGAVVATGTFEILASQ